MNRSSDHLLIGVDLSNGTDTSVLMVGRTGNIPFRSHTNDIDTAADIIYGFTDDEQDYEDALKIMANMRFGDYCLCDKYAIACVKE